MDPDREAIMAGEAAGNPIRKQTDHIFNYGQKAKRMNWKWGEVMNYQSPTPTPQ